MENPPRPTRPPSTRDRVTEWVTWFGAARLAASALAVLVVCAGAYWLTRTARPPTEAALPRTTGPAVVEATIEPPEPPASTSSGIVTVHVTGAVARPGVYELPDGARVQAAVDLAGGATADGDPNAINLAAPLVDGARVYVPAVGESVPTVPPVSPEAIEAAGPVDVNRASATELEELPGIGPATAAAIVAERVRNGPFVAVDDLDRVPGIGPAKLEALRGLVVT